MGCGWFPARLDGRLGKTRTDAPPGSEAGGPEETETQGNNLSEQRSARETK